VQPILRAEERVVDVLLVRMVRKVSLKIRFGAAEAGDFLVHLRGVDRCCDRLVRRGSCRCGEREGDARCERG